MRYTIDIWYYSQYQAQKIEEWCYEIIQTSEDD